MNFPVYLIFFIKSYLSNRKFFIEKEQVKSYIKNVVAGVPQGSVLGPLLFILYINDLPITKDIALGLFADDTCILTSSFRIDTIISRLEKIGNKIIKYFAKWKISANPSKTMAVIFTKRRPCIHRKIVLHNTEIEWTDKVNYLGVVLDQRLNFNEHIRKIVNKCTALLLTLYPLINKNSALNINNKLLIYKTLVRPNITYGCSAWCYISQSTYNSLQVIQNKFLRIIGNYRRYTFIKIIHDEFNIQFIKEYILNTAKKFYQNKSVKNNLIMSDINYSEKQYKHKRIKHNLI